MANDPKKSSGEPPEGEATEQRQGMKRICVASVTRGGRRIYARDYGLKAFCFWVKDDSESSSS